MLLKRVLLGCAIALICVGSTFSHGATFQPDPNDGGPPLPTCTLAWWGWIPYVSCTQ